MANVHDRIRGVPGAWSASVNGIKGATEVLAPRTRLVVSSLLLPSKRHYLDAMLERLREIGIDRWIINSLLRVGSGKTGGPVANRASLYRDLLILQEAADSARVRLTVDDEFDHLGRDTACASQPSIRRLHVRTLPQNVEIFPFDAERAVLDRRRHPPAGHTRYAAVAAARYACRAIFLKCSEARQTRGIVKLLKAGITDSGLACSAHEPGMCLLSPRAWQPLA